MSLATMPEAILAKHPELVPIFEALSAYQQGRPITARCPTCSQLLVVTDVLAVSTRWVTCEVGCTSYREKLHAGQP